MTGQYLEGVTIDTKYVTKVPAGLVIVGAIIVFIAFFLAWVNNPSFGGSSQNGIDMINNVDKWKVYMSAWQCYIPLIALILGIVAAIVAVLSLGGINVDKRIIDVAYIILALAAIIMIIYLMTMSYDFVSTASKTVSFKMIDHVGPGFIVAIVGEAIIGLVGVIDLIDGFEKVLKK